MSYGIRKLNKDGTVPVQECDAWRLKVETTCATLQDIPDALARIRQEITRRGLQLPTQPTTLGGRPPTIKENTMAIQAGIEERKEYVRLSDRTHFGVIAEITDDGIKKKVFEGKETSRREVTFYIEGDENDENGVPLVAWRTFGFTMYESPNGKLRPQVETLLGRKFKDNDEAALFDLETLVGQNVLFPTMQNKSADGTKTYVNITSIMPIPPGVPLREVSSGYLKAADRFKRRDQGQVETVTPSRKDVAKVLVADGSGRFADDAADGEDELPF